MKEVEIIMQLKDLGDGMVVRRMYEDTRYTVRGMTPPDGTASRVECCDGVKLLVPEKVVESRTTISRAMRSDEKVIWCVAPERARQWMDDIIENRI